MSAGEVDSKRDREIRLLREDADDLAELFEEPGEITEGELDYWAYNLSNELVGASRLEASYRAGEMRGEQEKRYMALRDKLRALAPDIERILKISMPPEILRDR